MKCVCECIKQGQLHLLRWLFRKASFNHWIVRNLFGPDPFLLYYHVGFHNDFIHIWLNKFSAVLILFFFFFKSMFMFLVVFFFFLCPFLFFFRHYSVGSCSILGTTHIWRITNVPLLKMRTTIQNKIYTSTTWTAWMRFTSFVQMSHLWLSGET